MTADQKSSVNHKRDRRASLRASSTRMAGLVSRPKATGYCSLSILRTFPCDPEVPFVRDRRFDRQPAKTHVVCRYTYDDGFKGLARLEGSLPAGISLRQAVRHSSPNTSIYATSKHETVA